MSVLPQTASWAESLLSDEEAAMKAAADTMASLLMDRSQADQHCTALSVLFRLPAVSGPLISNRNLECLMKSSLELVLKEGASSASLASPASDYSLKALNNFVMAHSEAQRMFTKPETGAGYLSQLLKICGTAVDATGLSSSALIACRFLFRLLASNAEVMSLFKGSEQLLTSFQHSVAFASASKLVSLAKEGKSDGNLYDASVFVAKLYSQMLSDEEGFPPGFSPSHVLWTGESGFAATLQSWLDYYRSATSTSTSNDLLLQTVNALFMLSCWAATKDYYRLIFLVSDTAGEQGKDAATGRLQVLTDHLIFLASKHDRGARALAASAGETDSGRGIRSMVLSKDHNLVAMLNVALKVVQAAPQFKPHLLAVLTEVEKEATTSSAAGAGSASSEDAASSSGTSASGRPSGKAIPIHTVHLLQTLDEGVQVASIELFWELCDENPQTLVEALTFPLAAGILQSKGAIALPAEATTATTA
jgi:hypothetical protein